MNAPKNDQRSEFGDFQTPADLCRSAMQTLRHRFPHFKPKTIIEPSCGIGAFVFAAADCFPSAEKIMGFERNAHYHAQAQKHAQARPDGDRFTLHCANFFDIDWDQVIRTLPPPLLVVGNPPWVTNSALGKLQSHNVPPKSNFQNHSGLDALTGKANFDISEGMLNENLKWITAAGPETNSCLAVLCKDSVARKVLQKAWAGQNLDAKLFKIDAHKNFCAAVEASFFVALNNNPHGTASCEVYDTLDSRLPSSTFGQIKFARGTRHGTYLISDRAKFERTCHFLGTCSAYRWHSGLKHDCCKVMELKREGPYLKNGFGDVVTLESDFLYPLLKSSDLMKAQTSKTHRAVIVPQRRIGEPTHPIEKLAPRTWDYLCAHAPKLDNRKSSIYRNKPRFSVFGVGDYSFMDWKVAISGFSKTLDFQVVGPIEGKPVIFDDTVYALGLEHEDDARFLCGLLHSQPCQEFIESMIFWDNKRPITVDLLKRIDLAKVADAIGKGAEYRAYTDRAKGSTLFAPHLVA